MNPMSDLSSSEELRRFKQAADRLVKQAETDPRIGRRFLKDIGYYRMMDLPEQRSTMLSQIQSNTIRTHIDHMQEGMAYALGILSGRLITVAPTKVDKISAIMLQALEAAENHHDLQSARHHFWELIMLAEELLDPQQFCSVIAEAIGDGIRYDIKAVLYTESA